MSQPEKTDQPDAAAPDAAVSSAAVPSGRWSRLAKIGQLATCIASWGGLYLLAARLKARVDVRVLVESTLAPGTLMQSSASTN